MPGKEFYNDLLKDTDFLEKFVQFHGHPKKRHINQYEIDRIRKIIGDHVELVEKTKTDLNTLAAFTPEESKLSRTFPANERGNNVKGELREIFSNSERIDIITGYSSMKEISSIQEEPNSQDQHYIWK